MRSGGSNIKPKHAEEISLSGLFLMEVTKTVDHEFGVHHTTSHTTRDAKTDITKLANNLMESALCGNQRNSPPFSDPTIIGLNKLCNTSWLKDTLNCT
jgi:hypothetical protein